jgi:predicted MFS family arabinose efflux permease
LNQLRIQIIAFSVIRVVLNTMHRMVYPYLAVFGRGLGVGLPALSLAVTARSTLGGLAPFLASAADSRGRKFGMLAGVLLFSFGTALVIIWPVYPAFFLAMVLSTLGKYAFEPAMHAYLGDHIPYQRRGLVMGLTEFAWSISFIAGVPLIGFLIARNGWMAPFPLFALLGLASAGALAWLLPKEDSPPEGQQSLRKNFRAVLSCTPALAGLAVGALTSSANEVVNLVFGVWMEDSFGLRIAALGAASVLIGLSELGGESLVSALTDRMGKERAIGVGIVLNSLAALALPFLGSSFFGALTGLFLFYITSEFTVVSAIPMMSELLPSARATLMSLNVTGHSTGRALGALLATPVYGAGIFASGLAAVALNLLALAALAWLIRKRNRTGVI